MGWKPGQGVGPRVTKIEKRKTKKRNVNKKIYGCSLPNEEFKNIHSDTESSGNDDDDDEEILFAPDDYEPFRSKPKDNYFGIGYSGLERRSVLGHVNLFDTPTFKIQDKNKKLSIRGQAFGVGAFEADDEDIYARDDMSRYDFTLGPAETKESSRSIKGNKSSRVKCLEGFVSAKNQLERKKVYNPPELPRDFKPIHVIKQSRFSPQAEPENMEGNYKRKGLGRHDLNAESRSVILGESSSNSSQTTGSPAANIIARTLNLHGREQTEERARQEAERTKASSSSSSWIDKLKKTSFVRGGVEGSGGGESSGKLKNLEDFKSQLLNEENNDYVKMSKPFVDETKQKRFEKFQEFSKDERKEKVKTIQPLSMTEWEREHEFEEFKLAAGICEKTNDTNNRFTKEAIASVDSDIPKDSMVDAAKAKMFGKLTRNVEAWQPASIVCKRFNIPEPNSGCLVQQEKSKKYSVFDSLDFCINNNKFKKATDTAGSYKEPDIPYRPVVKNNQNNIIDISDIDAGSCKSNDKIQNFEASYEKIFGHSSLSRVPTQANQDKSNDNVEMHSVITSSSTVSSKDKNDEKKDLFKAIFLSSSEEDSSDSDKDNTVDDDDVTRDTIKSVLIGKSENKVNVQRNNSPPRGIFAKLDLDNLLVPDKNSVKINKNSKEDEDEKHSSNANKVGNFVCQSDVEILPDMYGPVLPKKISNDSSSSSVVQGKSVFRSVVIPKLNVTGKDIIEWVEKSKNKKVKKEKKKHKHKEKKHKHKSKKSKK